MLKEISFLDFLICPFVGLGVLSTVELSDRLGFGSDLGSGVALLSGFFIVNVLLLKLFTTSSLALRRNPTFVRKDSSLVGFSPLFVFFYSIDFCI